MQESDRRASWRALLAAGVALAVTITGMPGSASAAPAGPDRPAHPLVAPADGPMPTARTVTLITGDRVTLHDSDYTIEPGPGRESILFEQYEYGDQHYVIPVDAAGMIGQGQLDRRLFDVAGLLAAGYGDADRSDLPLLVAHRPGAALASAATQVTRQLPELGITAVRAAKQDTGALWVSMRDGAATTATVPAATLPAGVTRIWLDGQRQLALDVSVPRIGAPAAWQAGFTGAGVTVAVLDSGIDLTHPDVAGKVVEVRNFTDASDGNDTQGHGTHVASILAGTGAASGGQYRGVAPDADLLVGKVCPTRSCPESSILAGMQWASAERQATVVNLSLGGSDLAGIDPLEEAVNRLTAQTGTLFVIAAGNNGTNQPVSSPASADAALAVGAVDRQDNLADLSSRGPRVGDTALKPDLTAPGIGIVAARAAGGTVGEPVDEHYTRASGTSMATPHVAGAAALLAQQHPDWTAERLKAALMGSAAPHPTATAFEQGAGRVDVAAAIELSVLTSPASISLGRHPFPQDGEPVARTVTYRNHGTTTVTRQLSMDVTGPAGRPAPAGMFAVQPGSVTLPPDGEADVTVTTDTSMDSLYGHFTGAVVATGGGVTVRTPIAVDKEAERVELTLHHVNRDGAATGNFTTSVAGVDLPVQERTEQVPGGTVTLRLPPGRYTVYSSIRTLAGEGLTVSALARPLLELTEDTSLTLDARVAEPMQVTVPHESASPALANLQYERRLSNGVFDFIGIVHGQSLDRMFTAQLGPAVADHEVTAALHSQWGERGDAQLLFLDSPYVYHLAWFQRGQYWTGFDEQVRRRDLAAVTADYRSPMPGRLGRQSSTGRPLDGIHSAAFAFPFRLPFTRTEWYLADDLRWHSRFETLNPETGLEETNHSSPFRIYRAGERRTEHWNRAVFGPAFPAADTASGSQWVYRHSGALPTIAGSGVAQGNDSIVLGVAHFNDFSPDHSGSSRWDTIRLALLRDGELVGETRTNTAEFPVPDDESTYRFEVEATRPSYAEVSTEVSAAWTFRSGHVPNTEFANLPVMAVRFGPKLDEQHGAPAGRPFLLPVSVERQANSPDPRLRSLRVEVSYDDGASWHPARTFWIGGGRSQALLLLRHPEAASFVSLRATAVDVADNSVEQTIIRAYQLR